MNPIKLILESKWLRKPMLKLAIHFYPKIQKNINKDLINPRQKRVLISYMPLGQIDFNNVSHAMYLHINQIIKYFIDKEYCIDICACNDINAYNEVKDNRYDILFGFGEVFKLLALTKDIKNKILFITENDPSTVETLYNDRISYFKKRHPKLNYKKAISRNGFFSQELFQLATCGIAMNSDFNIRSIQNNFNQRLYKINSNAISNPSFNFKKNILDHYNTNSKYNFIWFGSDGFIHKGLDLLLDVFKQIPQCTLNIYGLSPHEEVLYKKLKSANTINKGRINVLSEKFIQVITQNAFVILPSCSEGMNTGVATCMKHGMIPIVTKEAGFDSNDIIITLNDYRIETIKETIERLIKYSDLEIITMREKAYKYANSEFSLEKYTFTFSNIMNNILQNEN